MNNFEKLVSEMSLNRMAELLEKGEFCCGTHTTEDGFECLAYDLKCVDCLKNWLMEESK